MKISDDDEPWSYLCFKSGCPLSFEDAAVKKEHLLREHSWRMDADVDLKGYQQRREAAYKQSKGRRGLSSFKSKKKELNLRGGGKG